MKLTSGYEDRKARVEMVSLMDVMFLILVFFVYSIFSMSVHRGLKVTLPNAEGGKVKGEVTLITLSPDGSMALNKLKMPSNEIVRQTISLWQKDGRPVLISGDRAAPLGAGIELLEQLHKGGVEKVSFQVSGKTPANAQPSVPALNPSAGKEKGEKGAQP